MQNRFIELIAEEKKKGKTILLSSHMFEEAERTCDRIGIIRAGKLVTVDSVETLRERHMHTYTVTLDTLEDVREKGMFKSSLGKIKCAVCPACGYTETYIDNPESIKKLAEKDK